MLQDKRLELVNEVTKILEEVVGYDFSEKVYAQKIVDRILELLHDD